MGCLFILIGLWIFLTPTASFLSSRLFFNLALIVVGIFEMIFSIRIIREAKNWGGSLARGLFDLIIGALLLFNPFFTINLLPYLIAFWIMYRSIRAILFAYRHKSYGIKKWYWNLAFGIGTFVFELMDHIPHIILFLVATWKLENPLKRLHKKRSLKKRV